MEDTLIISLLDKCVFCDLENGYRNVFFIY